MGKEQRGVAEKCSHRLTVAGEKVTVTIGKNKTESDYQSVTNQAGIHAGKEGFDIEVGKNTDLKGGVIASGATPDKNKISTDTLTYGDIENKAEYSASSNGININTSAGAEYNEKGVTPNIGVKTEGNANSTTNSAIAEGTIEIRSDKNKDLSDLSRDTEKSLNQLGEIFDKKTVEEKQELAEIFGKVAFEEVHNLSKNEKAKAQKALDQAKAANKPQQEIDKLQGKVNAWDEGGSNKIALHALVGGIMADLGGGSALSGAAGAGLNEALQKELKEKCKDQPDLWQWASAAIGGAAAKIVGGDSSTGASTAVSGTKNNTQAEREMANSTSKSEATTDAINENISGTEDVTVDPSQESQTDDDNKNKLNDGYENDQTQEMKPSPEKEALKNPAKTEGNVIKENNQYYRIEGGEKVKVPAEDVEGKGRYYVEGQGWYENVNGADTYIDENRVIDGKQWKIDKNGKDVYIGEVPEAFETLSKKQQDVVLKLASAESIAEKIEYVGAYLGKDWKDRIDVFWKGQYSSAISNGMTPELAEMAADFTTGEVIVPVIGGIISKGGVVASDLGALEKNLGKVPSGSSKAGTVTGSLGGLTPAERAVINDLISQGKNVEVIPRSTVPNVKTPDFLVDGVKTELKTLQNCNTNTGMKRIQDAFNQGAEKVIIDARQSGLSPTQAQEIINRAAGKFPEKQFPGRVEIWTTEGTIIN